MIRAISVSDSSLNKTKVSFSSKLDVQELPCAKKMNVLNKDKFTKNGILCGVDLSFEDA